MEPKTTFTTPEELQDFLFNYLQEVDVLTLSSPFLPKTFTKIRSDLYSQYNGTLSSFISIVDNLFFPKFLKLVYDAYHVSIIKDPSLLDLPKFDEMASEMIQILTEWSVQIEVSADLIQRCKLYKIYEISDSQEQVFQDLRKEWKNTDNHSNALYRYFVGHFSVVTEQCKSFVSGRVCDYMINNIVELHGYTISRIFLSYFTGSMPYPIIALLGAKFVWMFIGTLSDKIGERVLQPLEKVNMQLKLAELKLELKGMTKELSEKNKSISILIPESLTNKKSKKYLKSLIDATMNHKSENHPKSQGDYDSYISQFSYIHDDDDWVVIDRPPMYPEVLEGWDLIE